MSISRLGSIGAAAVLLASAFGASAADRAGETTRSQQNAFQWSGVLPDTLAEGDEIYQQAEVYTKDHGSLELTFDDSSVLTLGPNSDLVIDEFVYAPDTNTGSSALRLGKGALRMISGSIPSGNVRVDTPVATVGIRGTDFILDTRTPGNLKVWSKEGTVVVSPTGSNEQFELVAPSYASCSSASCNVGGSSAEPSFFPVAPADPSGRDRGFGPSGGGDGGNDGGDGNQ